MFKFNVSRNGEKKRSTVKKGYSFKCGKQVKIKSSVLELPPFIGGFLSHVLYSYLFFFWSYNAGLVCEYSINQFILAYLTYRFLR